MSILYSATHADKSLDGFPVTGRKWMQVTLVTATTGAIGAVNHLGKLAKGAVLTGLRYVCPEAGTAVYNIMTRVSSNSTDAACTSTIATELINKVAHGLTAGTPIVFHGATGPDEITFGVVYYVSSQSLTAGSFRLSTTKANALAGTSITLTTAELDATATYTAFKNTLLAAAADNTGAAVALVGPIRCAEETDIVVHVYSSTANNASIPFDVVVDYIYGDTNDSARLFTITS